MSGFSRGSFDTLKPMADLGDKEPYRPAGQRSLSVGINAAYSTQASGTMRPFLKAQKKKTVKKEKWSQKYKDSIDCDNPKGFSQKAHCQGKKKKNEETKRVPRQYKSQDPDKHSDLYTDENPKGTIKGLGFVDGVKARESIKKIDNSGKTHAHKMQAAMAMHQRARVAADRAKNTETKKNLSDAEGVYKNYIEKMKKITIKRRKSK
jgi:hypothetical protein